MQGLIRTSLCAFLICSTGAIAQEIAGITAQRPELAVGTPAEILIAFRTNHNSNQSGKDNMGWSCGLNVSFGDGRVEFFRIDSDKVPVRLTHQYASPGNYAVTLEGKLQFKGLNTVLPCVGKNVGTAIIVRAEDFAAREAAERAAKQEALDRAAADRAAADRAADQARSDRLSAERAAQQAAAERATAEKQRAAARAAAARAAAAAPPKPAAAPATAPATAPAATAAPATVARPPVKAKSAMDL